MSDYTFDIFISYKRDKWGVFDEWLNIHFIPLFMSHVSQAITAHSNRLPLPVFFDQAKITDDLRRLDGIEPGEEWRKALENAIKVSRCVVALWSPEYFFPNGARKSGNLFLCVRQIW